MENYAKIERNGYGSKFNILFINNTKTKIMKKARDKYGIQKLSIEINFYKYIKSHNYPILMPEIYYIGHDYIIIEYIQNDIFDDEFNIFDRVLCNLSTLHASDFKIVEKNVYVDLLKEEIVLKIEKRRKEIIHILNEYDEKIKYVNGTKLLSYNDIMQFITDILTKHVETIKEYKLFPIHGDPQFNNVIVNNDKIYFIDPKGSFGSMLIYGLKEYDIAKLYFSMSGYSFFDTCTCDKLNIFKDNFIIDFLSIPIIEDELVKALFISIWLGNAHMFVDQPKKVITSYYIALYFGSYFIIHSKESIVKTS